jgi:hypothetical protein
VKLTGDFYFNIIFAPAKEGASDYLSARKFEEDTSMYGGKQLNL